MSVSGDVEVLYCAQHGGFSLSSKVVKELYRWYPDLFKQLESDPVNSKIIDEAAFLRPESNLRYDYVRGADGKVQYITNILPSRKSSMELLNLK